jgi:hypothetical protein
MDPHAILDACHNLISQGRTGFTIDIHGKEYPPDKGGFAVGTRRFADLRHAISSLTPDFYLGWWRSEDGEEHVDLVQIYSAKATAFLAAYLRGELAIYDFSNDSLIDCRHFYTSNHTERATNEESTSPEVSPQPEGPPQGHQGQEHAHQ